MFKPYGWALAGVAAALTAATAAGAETVRQPTSGTPAVAVDLPSGWTTDRPNVSSLNLFNPAHNGVVSVAIETTPADFSLIQFRDNYFKAAQCTPMDRTETVRVAGRTGTAYYCQPTQGPLAPARVVLLHIDPTHVLSVGHSYRMDATGADVQALEKAMADLRLEP